MNLPISFVFILIFCNFRETQAVRFKKCSEFKPDVVVLDHRDLTDVSNVVCFKKNRWQSTVVIQYCGLSSIFETDVTFLEVFLKNTHYKIFCLLFKHFRAILKLIELIQYPGMWKSTMYRLFWMRVARQIFHNYTVAVHLRATALSLSQFFFSKGHSK